MTTMTEQALYSVGQLVEFRDGPGRPFDKTGRITEVSRASHDSGGWQYELEEAGDRPRANLGKYQTNVRPYFEEGDVVRVSVDPKCWMDTGDGHSEGEPRGWVAPVYAGKEGAVTRVDRSMSYMGVLQGEYRGDRGDYVVRIPEEPDGFNLIAPEHLTLVRKASEEPAFALNVGDEVEIWKFRTNSTWQRAKLVSQNETHWTFEFLEGDREGEEQERPKADLHKVRRIATPEPPAPDPNIYPQWVPQIGDIARLEDGTEVEVTRLYPSSYDCGFDYNGRTNTVDYHRVQSGAVRLARRPGTEAQSAPNPVAERLAFEPRVGDEVMALEFDNRPGGRYVRARVSSITTSAVRPYRVVMLEGERENENYGRSITMLRPLETPTTSAPEPRPFNVRDVKIGDKVEVYATENGEPFAGGNEYIQDGDGLGAWRLGTVVHTDPGDDLPLGVQVEGAGDWWWFKTFQIRQAASQEPEAPQERRPFNWRDVKVGDEVEVYATPSGSRLSSPTAPMGAWQRGTVREVEDPAYGGTLALRVRVGDTSHWREEGTVRWPLDAPAPEVRGEAVAPQPDLLELAKKAAADKAVAELKSTIGDRAMALAKEHGWCSETEEALRLMGIDPNIQIGGEVTVKFRVSAELMSRVRSEPVLVDNPARFLKENIVPKLEGLGGLTAHDVQVMEVQVNRVSKTRKEA